MSLISFSHQPGLYHSSNPLRVKWFFYIDNSFGIQAVLNCFELCKTESVFMATVNHAGLYHKIISLHWFGDCRAWSELMVRPFFVLHCANLSQWKGQPPEKRCERWQLKYTCGEFTIELIKGLCAWPNGKPVFFSIRKLMSTPKKKTYVIEKLNWKRK